MSWTEYLAFIPLTAIAVYAVCRTLNLLVPTNLVLYVMRILMVAHLGLWLGSSNRIIIPKTMPVEATSAILHKLFMFKPDLRYVLLRRA